MFVSQKIVLKLFGLKYISGLFLARSIPKSVSHHFFDLLTTTSVKHWTNSFNISRTLLNATCWIYLATSWTMLIQPFCDIWCEQRWICLATLINIVQQMKSVYFRASNWTHILLTSRHAWFLQCFHILSLTVKACQISLDYWLFAWMNFKRRSFTTTKFKWLIFIALVC